MSLNQLVVQIQGLSGTNVEDLKQLKTLLSKSDDQLVKNCDKLDDCLNALDPATQSLGYMFFLYASLSHSLISTIQNYQNYWRDICDFLKLTFASDGANHTYSVSQKVLGSLPK